MLLIWQLVVTLPLFRIQKVVVRNNITIPTQRVNQALRITSKDNIFQISKKVLKKRLLSLPQLKTCSIAKIPPSTLEIFVVEKKPLANIILDTQNLIIDDEGTILNESGFRYNYPVETLPIIRGNNLVALIDGGLYISSDHVKFIVESLVMLHRTMPDHSYQIAMENLNHVIVVIDDVLMIKFGTIYDVDAKMTAFRILLQDINDKWGQVDYVDIRYPKFPAIKWRS